MNQNNLDQYQLKPQIFFIGFNASKEVVKNVTNQLIKIDYSQLGEKNYYFTDVYKRQVHNLSSHFFQGLVFLQNLLSFDLV